MNSRRNFRAAPLALTLATAFAAAIGATALLSMPATAGEDSGSSDVRRLREEGKVLPMEEILARSRQAQPGQVVEVELENEDGRYIYEVKIIDDADRVHKLELDAASGEVRARESK